MNSSGLDGSDLLRTRQEDEDRGTTVRVGLALGIAFGVCFVTGVLSHLIQHPPGWFAWPAHPVWLYRFTQGLHVLTGIAAIPLLLVKLGLVYRKLFERPIFGSGIRIAERAGIAVLVSSAVFELVTGLLNIAHWYPWAFFFPAAHHAVAYVAIGALLIHIAVKFPIIRRAFGEGDAGGDGGGHSPPVRPDAATGPSRRTVLRATSAGVGLAVVAFAGQTVTPLRRLAFLAPRSGTGPQGLPINRTASAARIGAAATSADYRLVISNGSVRQMFSVAALESLPQYTVRLPIACVEGWSASAQWTGIRLRDLVAAVGGRPESGARMVSLERGAYAVADIPGAQVSDDLTLIALLLNGDRLTIDHGYPARLIAPGLPGVMQTKWLSRIEART
ncbi:molybdopterin-dependent oxidoreductase [Gordonia sp. DT219]|uniref:molybdopterin-dependent oxidoreductase n=1 Tax=Gordonia sp. DT219 TaxID=3416658 RepID=UPI003CF05F8E